jgi:hypothetical protein
LLGLVEEELHDVKDVDAVVRGLDVNLNQSHIVIQELWCWFILRGESSRFHFAADNFAVDQVIVLIDTDFRRIHFLVHFHLLLSYSRELLLEEFVRVLGVGAVGSLQNVDVYFAWLGSLDFKL